MFNNIKYLDPELYLPYNEPLFNSHIEPSDFVSQFPLTENNVAIIPENPILMQGLMAYDSNTDSGNFSNLADAQSRTNYNPSYVIISQINSSGTSHVSGYSDNFRQKFIGYIKITESGTYWFQTGSDDGSVFGLNGTQVAYASGAGSGAGSIELTPGIYKIEYYQVEQGGGQSWNLSWKKPGDSSYSTVPSSVFFYSTGWENYDNGGKVLTESGDISYDFLLGSKFSGYLYSEDEDFLFTSSIARAYSLWYKYDTAINGTILSLNDSGASFVLYLENGNVKFYDSILGTMQLCTLDESDFEDQGKKHILFILQYTGTTLEFYVNNELKYSSEITLSTSASNFRIGNSDTFTDYQGVLNGWIKALRVYNRALNSEERSTLMSEFTTLLGTGATWERPLGRLPDVIDENTLYLVRRKSYLRLDFSSSTQTTTKFGIWGFPYPGDSLLNNLPQEVIDCPWLGDETDAVAKQSDTAYTFSSSVLQWLELRNIEIIKHESKSDYIFDISTSSRDSVIYIDRCRFSSNSTNLDKETSRTYTSMARNYLRQTGIVGNLNITNCVINHVSDYYDAFRFRRCVNAIISANEVFSATTGTDNWNGYTFAFIGSTTGNYSDVRDNTSDTYLNNLIFENNNYNISTGSGTVIPGLLGCIWVIQARISNVICHTINNLTTVTDSIRNHNGIIYLRGLSNYLISDIQINLPECSKIPVHSLLEVSVTNPGINTGTTERLSANYNKLIKNITIDLAQSAYSTTSTKGEISSFDGNYPYRYSAMSFISLSNLIYKLHMCQNISVDFPMGKALSLVNTNGIELNIKGSLLMYDSSARIESLESETGYYPLQIIGTSNVYIKDFNVAKSDSDPIVLNNINHSHVYVENSNIVPFNPGIGYDSVTFADANFYVKNMGVTNGSFLKGISHSAIPVQTRRLGGHSISLRLCKNKESNVFFQIPPYPSKGIERIVYSGDNKLTIYFSHMEDKTLDEITQGLYIQVDAGAQSFDSRFSGKWSVDPGEWNNTSLQPFKYEISFSAEEEIKIYIRVYYNMTTKYFGGIYMDPEFEITQEGSNSL